MLPIWMRELKERLEMERRVRLGVQIESAVNTETGEDVDLDDIPEDLLKIIEEQNELKYGDLDEVDDSDY